MDPVENRNQSLSNQFPINEEDEGSTYGQQPNAYSPTLAPPLQSAHLNPSSSSQMQINASTYAPFAFDSPFPFHQPFGVGYPISGQGQQYINHPHGPQNANNAGIVQHASTPFDFDSLFEYTDKNIQQQQQQQIQQQASDSGSLCLDRQGAQTQGEGTATRDTIEAHLPIDYWEDANFVDRIMSGFRDVRDRVDEQSQMRQNTQQSSTSSGEHSFFISGRVSYWWCFSQEHLLLTESFLLFVFLQMSS